MNSPQPLEKVSLQSSPALNEKVSPQPSPKASPQLPRKKVSSGHVSSPTQLVHDLKRLNESTKMILSNLSESCYAHFREEGVAMKETQDQSPRTKHVQKMLRRSVRLLNPIDQTITLTEPVEAIVQTKRRSEGCLDVSDVKLFQEYLNQRMAILGNHQRSPEQLDQQPIVRTTDHSTDETNQSEGIPEPGSSPMVQPKKRSSKTIRPVLIESIEPIEAIKPIE